MDTDKHDKPTGKTPRPGDQGAEMMDLVISHLQCVTADSYVERIVELARTGDQDAGIEAINLLISHLLCSAEINPHLRGYFVEALERLTEGAQLPKSDTNFDPRAVLNIKNPPHRRSPPVKVWERASVAHFIALGRSDPEMSITEKTNLTIDWCSERFGVSIDGPSFNKSRKKYKPLEDIDDDLLSFIQLRPR